jgi:hypothetical protein
LTICKPLFGQAAHNPGELIRHRSAPPREPSEHSSHSASLSRRAHMPCALMPPFVAQQFLQGSQMDFRISPAETFDISLESGLIGPAKHLVELLPEEKTNERKRQFLKFHFFAEDAAKDLGRLGIGELATGDLKLLADKFLGTLEGERDEGANVVGGDRLIRFTGADRIHELTVRIPISTWLM